MNIDYSISIGHIFEIVSFLVGGIYALAMIKSNVGMLKDEVGKMQTEIEKLSEIISRQAAAESRLNALDTRMGGFDKDIRELRHGKGWVTGPHGIDHEYP